MADNQQSSTAELVEAAGTGAADTTEAAQRAAAGMAAGSIRLARDVVGVGQAGVDLAQKIAESAVDLIGLNVDTVQKSADDILEDLEQFARTGRRPD